MILQLNLENDCPTKNRNFCLTKTTKTMKIRILLLLLILFGIPSSSFISNANENLAKEVPIEQVAPPVERQKLENKRPKEKKSKRVIKAQKKQEEKKKWLPWLLGLLSIPLVAGAIAWGIYFLPSLAGFGAGCATSTSCWGVIGIFVATILSFLGTAFFILMVLGAVALITLAIVIAYRYKHKDDKAEKIKSVNLGNPEIKELTQTYPLLSSETIDLYLEIKSDVEKLEKKKDSLEKISFRSELGNKKVEEEIADVEKSIEVKKAKMSEIENSHAELENVAPENRAKYISIKLRLLELTREKALYENKTDERSLDKLNKIKDLILKNQADLGMLRR